MVDKELIEALEKIKWPVDFGEIKVKLWKGKPVLIAVERTYKKSNSEWV